MLTIQRPGTYPREYKQDKMPCQPSGRTIHTSSCSFKKPIRQVSKTWNPFKIWAHVVTQLIPWDSPNPVPSSTLLCPLSSSLPAFNRHLRSTSFVPGSGAASFFNCWNHALDWANLRQFTSMAKENKKSKMSPLLCLPPCPAPVRESFVFPLKKP